MSPFNLFGKKKPEASPEPAAPPAAEASQATESKGLFGRLLGGLAKTREKVAGGLRTVLSIHRTLDDALLDEVEEQLYLADVGPRSVMQFSEGLRDAYRQGMYCPSKRGHGVRPQSIRARMTCLSPGQ